MLDNLLKIHDDDDPILIPIRIKNVVRKEDRGLFIRSLCCCGTSLYACVYDPRNRRNGVINLFLNLGKVNLCADVLCTSTCGS